MEKTMAGIQVVFVEGVYNLSQLTDMTNNMSHHQIMCLTCFTTPKILVTTRGGKLYCPTTDTKL